MPARLAEDTRTAAPGRLHPPAPIPPGDVMASPGGGRETVPVTVQAIAELSPHRADPGHRCARRRRVQSWSAKKHAFARSGFCRDRRRAVEPANLQVASGARPVSAGGIVGSLSFYDPTTGTFLTRDPINALTRSADGYVYGNPLNDSDPTGLYCLTGVAGHDLNGAEICNGAAEVLDNVRGGRADQLGVTASICSIVCVGLEFRNGNLYFDYGAGAHLGGGVDLNYCNQPQAEEESESINRSALAVGGQFGLDDCQQIDWEDWGVGAGKGKGTKIDVGVSYRRQRKILG